MKSFTEHTKRVDVWLGEGEEIVAGVSDGQGPRCLKCGSKRHDSSSCTTNLDKLKCFKMRPAGTCFFEL